MRKISSVPKIKILTINAKNANQTSNKMVYTEAAKNFAKTTSVLEIGLESSNLKVPIFAWFYKRGGIMVNRKDEKSRVRSYEAMKQTLQKGIHMCLYPEGTRNRTDKPLKEFYDGAFKLAVDTKKEIIPCVIIGTNKAMPIHKAFYFLPTKLKMIFLPPVSSENIDAKSLNKKVYDMMYGTFVSAQ